MGTQKTSRPSAVLPSDWMPQYFKRDLGEKSAFLKAVDEMGRRLIHESLKGVLSFQPEFVRAAENKPFQKSYSLENSKLGDEKFDSLFDLRSRLIKGDHELVRAKELAKLYFGSATVRRGKVFVAPSRAEASTAFRLGDSEGERNVLTVHLKKKVSEDLCQEFVHLCQSTVSDSLTVQFVAPQKKQEVVGSAIVLDKAICVSERRL